jgi:prepilin-type N-terminal cleavage/methylation domain-containing protein
MTSRARRCGGGSTLIEMLVALALLGILASVTTLAIRRMAQPAPDDPMTIIADTINAVIRSGRPTTLQFIVNGRPALATLNPDGSIVADTVLHIDRFTGQFAGRGSNAR